MAVNLVALYQGENAKKELRRIVRALMLESEKDKPDWDEVAKLCRALAVNAQILAMEVRERKLPCAKSTGRYPYPTEEG